MGNNDIDTRCLLGGNVNTFYIDIWGRIKALAHMNYSAPRSSEQRASYCYISGRESISILNHNIQRQRELY